MAIEHPEALAAWGIYLIAMVVIGYWAAKQMKTTEDYTVAGRKTNAFLVALSHGAGAMSGFMFLGLPGYAYTQGLYAFWYEAGDAGGGYVNFTLLGRRLRTLAAYLKAISPIDFLAKRYNDPTSSASKYIPLVGGLIGVIFMWQYLLAQVVAAGKVAQVLMGIPYTYGVLIGGTIVLIYVAAGGLLACMLTDAIQGSIMFLGAIIGLIVGFDLVGGFSGLTNSLMSIDPTIFSPWGRGLQFQGQYGEIIGALLIYMVGYMGLPHIVAFHMSAKSVREITKSILINPIWASVFAYACVLLGLFGVILLPGLSDPELAAPTFFYKFVNPWIAGALIAAVYAAIMSTADTLSLNSASALVNDIYARYINPSVDDKKRLLYNRIATLALGGLALLVALIPGLSVFFVVVSAFGTLASAFMFPNLAAVYWKRATPAGVLASMIGGAFTNAFWEILGLRAFTHLHPFFAGIIVSGALLVIVSLLTKPMPEDKQKLVDISKDHFFELKLDKVVAKSSSPETKIIAKNLSAILS